MPHAFLCDFDGTVSPFDIGAAFVRRFSPDGVAESPAFLERWFHGEMGHRELTTAQCAQLSVTREQAMDFARTFTLDPEFAPFVREAGVRGDAVAVMSEGFDFYVASLLERDGLAHLPWSANTAVFDQGRVTVAFPESTDGCGRCGNCKGAHVRAWRARGYHTVLIGDGLSDRCGAGEADTVLARRDLLAWCRSEGVEAIPFESFADVRQVAGEMGRAAQPAGDGWAAAGTPQARAAMDGGASRGMAEAAPGRRRPRVSPPQPIRHPPAGPEHPTP